MSRVNPTMKIHKRILRTTESGTAPPSKIVMTAQKLRKGISIIASELNENLKASRNILVKGMRILILNGMTLMMAGGERESSPEMIALRNVKEIDLVLGPIPKENVLTNLESDGVSPRIETTDHRIEREGGIVPLETGGNGIAVAIAPEVTPDVGQEVDLAVPNLDLADRDRGLVDPDPVDPVIGKRSYSSETSHSTRTSKRWIGFFQNTDAWWIYTFLDRTREMRPVDDQA